MYAKHYFRSTLLAASLFPLAGIAQDLPTDLRQEIGSYLDNVARREVSIGRIKIDSVATKGKTLQLFANINCSYIPFREDNVDEIYRTVKSMLPAEWASYQLEIRTNGRSIEEQIPLALRSKKNKKAIFPQSGKNIPLVSKKSSPYTPTRGLNNRHIAMWQSHGFYYEAKLDRWEWQRARIFQTVEDLYTQSYVLPFLVPMLENAGANVLLPRERDTQTHEVIVDNDGCLDGSRSTLNAMPTINGATARERDSPTSATSTKTLKIPFRKVPTDKPKPSVKEKKVQPNGYPKS